MQIKLSQKNLESVVLDTKQCVARGVSTNPTFVVNQILATHYETERRVAEAVATDAVNKAFTNAVNRKAPK